jgi:hypothetical protein
VDRLLLLMLLTLGEGLLLQDGLLRGHAPAPEHQGLGGGAKDDDFKRTTFKVVLMFYIFNPELGVLNRNIAGSARLVSYGTYPPGYIGWAYVAWRTSTKPANLAQPCLNSGFRALICKAMYVLTLSFPSP